MVSVVPKTIFARPQKDAPGQHDATKPTRAPYSELVLIFDKITHRVIDKYVPFDELQDRVPHTCRHTPDLAVIRIRGALFCGGITAVIGLVIGFILTQVVLLPQNPVVGSVAFAIALASGLGWWLAPILIGQPFWTLIRQWDEIAMHDESLPENERKRPVILPLDHTYCRGVTADVWNHHMEMRRLHREDQMRAKAAEQGVELPEGATESITRYGMIHAGAEDDGYIPFVNRGEMVYETLLARNATERLKGKGRNRMQKLQVGSSIALAALIVILIFFYIIMSQGGG